MSRASSGLRCFVATLALLSLFGRALSLAAGVACHNNNPFILIMAKQGIRLYKEPKKVDTICRAEFAKYGTCCDESQLTTFAREDHNSIQQDHEALIQEYTTLIEISKDLVAALSFISTSSVSHPSGSPALYQKIFKAKEVILSDEFKFLKENSMDSAADRIKTFSRKNFDCWMALSKERDASICPSCSGRSNHFFKNGKILISVTKCNELAEVCKQPMQEISHIYRLAETLRKVTARIADAGIVISQRHDLQNSNDVLVFSEWLKSHRADIRSAKPPVQHSGLQSYKPNALAKEDNRPLCEIFVRMRERIMVDQMTKVLRQYTGMAVGIENSLAGFLGVQGLPLPKLMHPATNTPKKSPVGRSGSNWGVGPRLLQFGGSPPPLGSDATFVDPTDPSYTSVGVSGHGPVADNTTFP